MSETRITADDREAMQDKAEAHAFRTADWLHLAAAPTFAAMALLTYATDGGAANMLCPAAQGMSPLGGMTMMYLLMGIFHAGPWLKRISAWGNRACRQV